VSRARVDWLAGGRVGRPHGLDGSFYVTRPRSQLLVVGATTRVGERETEIVRRAGTAAQPIVRVAGVDTREAADALRGEDLVFARGAVPVLEPDEWWAEDLEDCRVIDGAVEVGSVRRMLSLPSCEVLEVERVGGATLLVPLVRDAVRSVDVDAGVIDVDLRFLGEEP
jgi:16S rRNA processing protein RimM